MASRRLFLYAGVTYGGRRSCSCTYVWLPETKGRSLEKMDMLFDLQKSCRENVAMPPAASTLDSGGGDRSSEMTVHT
uniref:Uncharacterized protein n=1 Tax=Leersia perrieri TaxID=77586 RepID=A0A0D9XUI3_9ORYZ